MRKFFGLEKVHAGLVIKNLALIALGSLVSAAGINAFLVPHRFLSGGISGLSLFFSYFTPVAVGTYLLVFNIPIFIFGWRYVGRTFVVGSMVGTAMLAAGLYATAWMSGMGWAPEPLLSAFIGGALSGMGTGLVFRTNSSQGGTDVIAVAIKKRWSISIGTVSFAFNAVIVLALALKYGLHPALYTIASFFCSAIAIDKILIGLDRSRAVIIMTSEPAKIADLIMKKLNRGVTFLEGEGAYLHHKQKVIFCVVSLRQLARVKHYVRTSDPGAFMTVAEAGEVLGKGFKAVPI